MSLHRSGAAGYGRRIKYIKPDAISAGWPRLRAGTVDGGLAALAGSIRRFGVLEPLIVRRSGGGFTLVAGGRRLEAARMAGLGRVPCVVLRGGAEDSDCAALAENLQRRSLDFLETAEGLRRLMTCHRLPVEEAAERAGLPTEAAISKLRTLALPREMLLAIRDGGLTERHALALLRISDGTTREAALCEMAYRGIEAESAGRYVDALLKHGADPAPAPKLVYAVRDVRAFLNSVDHGVALMRDGGVSAVLERADGADGSITLTIRIPGDRARPEGRGPAVMRAPGRG